MSSKARVVRYAKAGGPEVLAMETIDLPDPATGEVQIRQTVVGLNYQDCYFRSGFYPAPLPGGVGTEAAGTVEKVGEGVTDFKVGDRVVYAGGASGSYADLRNMPAARVVAIPDGMAEEDAAAILMKGMTAEYLITRCYPIKKDELVLFYAASGGVGLIAGQWGKHIGARMIGVASGAEKCRKAKENGYEFVIDRSREDVLARVKEISGGAGLPVVFDSIGKATFDTTVESLAPRGMFVSFGTTTGAPPPVEASLLQHKGSLYFTRPTLATYCATRELILMSSKKLFDLFLAGKIKSNIGKRYAMSDAVQAHEDLEAGRTVGASLLIP
ncbi:quinone oxidoreductase family protein [Rhodovulum sp. PH10]|uniref:quinone oxidoreductase family protein n=1 Tax=Rhodovulum sp. PH10 TaxID=1187851 RepID=UPI00058E12E8|nr:quinone oxidoreductase [Rhodovulum sp. PH10]